MSRIENGVLYMDASAESSSGKGSKHEGIPNGDYFFKVLKGDFVKKDKKSEKLGMEVMAFVATLQCWDEDGKHVFEVSHWIEVSTGQYRSNMDWNLPALYKAVGAPYEKDDGGNLVLNPARLIVEQSVSGMIRLKRNAGKPGDSTLWPDRYLGPSEEASPAVVANASADDDGRGWKAGWGGQNDGKQQAIHAPAPASGPAAPYNQDDVPF